MNKYMYAYMHLRKSEDTCILAGPRPSIDKARDSSFSLISLAADSLLYNAVSTIPLFLSLCM